MVRVERLLTLAGALAWAALSPLSAAVCPVPSAGHPTIDSAVRDPICTIAALGVQSFAEDLIVDRDFEIQGGGPTVSVIDGTLRALGAGTSVTLASLRVDGTGAGVVGCHAAVVEAATGAEILGGPDVEVLAGGAASDDCRLFIDGFEAGSTLAWSAAVP